MSFNVYIAEYAKILNHKAIYIEFNPTTPRMSKGGCLYHITRNLLQGIKYNPKGSIDPKFLASHIPNIKKKIGTITKGDVTKFETEYCQAVPTPQAQLTLSGKQLYPGTPLYRCGD